MPIRTPEGCIACKFYFYYNLFSRLIVVRPYHLYPMFFVRYLLPPLPDEV